MARTIDQCKPLKTRGGGGGSKLTVFETASALLSSVKWLDAQHQYMVIAQRAVGRPALHAVAATAATVATAAPGRTRTRPRLTPRR
jgi:hypothetical protein